MRLKRIFISTLSLVFLVAVFQVGLTYAVEEGSDSTQSTTETETETETESETSSNPDKLTLQERIDKRKADQQTRLTNSQKQLLKGKCRAAQGRIKAVVGRVNGIETSRSKLHANIVKHLTDLSVKLKDKGIDTTQLDTDITALQELITKFNDDFALYKSAITDLEAMDCEADPEGFKASLDSAREILGTVKEDAKAVRTYVYETIKPNLKTIRSTLEKDEE